MKPEEKYKQTTDQVFSALKTSPGGLSSREAEARLKKYGNNELPKEENHALARILWSQISSPLVFVLFAAAIISFAVGEMLDVAVIFAIVILNTVVGFWQEYKADKSIEELNNLVQYFVHVIRDGKVTRIDTKSVVPGDVIVIESGDKISADARLFQTNNLEMNEASLTGESFPVTKQTAPLNESASVGDRSNMIWMGTSVSRGRGMAVVTAVGRQTQIGQIASLVRETKEEKTPLQIQMYTVSKFLTVAVLLSALVIFAAGVYHDLSLEELLVTTAALAVAAIPEGLLVSLTLVLVFGMRRILAKKALVRKLIAAETLGSVSIVCSDKTGTITRGVMEVDQLLVGGMDHHSFADLDVHAEDDSESPHLLALKIIALCNNSYVKNPEEKLKDLKLEGDATDQALLKAALQAGYEKENLKEEYPRLDEIPFNETYKYQATLHRFDKDRSVVFAKGAPEVILEMSADCQIGSAVEKMTDAMREEKNNEYRKLTQQGLRVLALAYFPDDNQPETFDEYLDDRTVPKLENLIFLGWVGLKDPVRPEVKKAFQTMKQAGISTVIITGDHKFTVKAIAEEMGMMVPENRILTGKDLDQISDPQLLERVQTTDIFARVEPRHKLRIIQAWKKQGAVVAMLGDGVNDAPALKAADIGVAIGEASTDVAKETSDIILLDGNFSTIEAAISEGRIIFDNIRKIFLYLMADSFTEILLIGIAISTGYPLPLAAVQILWINILSDGLPNLALTMEPGEPDVMSYPPRKKDERIVNKEILVLILSITFVAVTAAMSLFLYFYHTTGDLAYTRSLVFTAFAIDSIIYVFSVKSLRTPIWKTNLLNNKWLIGAAMVSISLQVLVVHVPLLGQFLKTVPLKPEHWLLIVVVGLSEIVIRELIKWVYWHGKRQTAA